MAKIYKKGTTNYKRKSRSRKHASQLTKEQALRFPYDSLHLYAIDLMLEQNYPICVIEQELVTIQEKINTGEIPRGKETYMLSEDATRKMLHGFGEDNNITLSEEEINRLLTILNPNFVSNLTVNQTH